MKSIVHEVTHGNDKDGYRTYITCYAENGEAWEIRAAGDTKEDTEAEAKRRYEDSFEHWDIYGIPLSWPRKK